MVWVQGQLEPVQLGIAAACGAHLIQTGNGRDAVRMGGDHFTGETVEPGMEPLLCADKMRGMWERTVAVYRKFNIGKIQRMPEVFQAPADTPVAGQEADGGKAEV